MSRVRASGSGAKTSVWFRQTNGRGRTRVRRQITTGFVLSVLAFFSALVMGTTWALFPENQSRVVVAGGGSPGGSPRAAKVDEFRSTQLERVLAPPLEVSSGTPYEAVLNNKTLRCVPTNFTSVSWEGAEPATYRINGLLVYPDNGSGDLGKAPAVVVMHGLNGAMGHELVSWAEEYASRGFVALTYSHPGHGNSGGPKPYHGNFGTDSFYGKEHFFLLVATCIRAVTLLESVPEVDASNIVLTGTSYGGLTTLLTSAVFYDHVRAGIPLIASGDFEDSFQTKGMMLSHVFGNREGVVTDNWTDHLRDQMDPAVLVADPRTPPQLMLFGTDDDFFTLESGNATLAALGEGRGYVVLNPNAHHGLGFDPAGFPNFYLWGSIEYFLEHAINGSDPPPTYQVTPVVDRSLAGEGLEFYICVTGPPAQAQFTGGRLFYRYTGVLGEPWRSVPLGRVSTPNGDVWHARLPKPVLTSEVEYFVQGELDSEGRSAGVYFSSRVHGGVRVVSYWSWLWVGCLVVASLVLVALRFDRLLRRFDDYLLVEGMIVGGGSPNRVGGDSAGRVPDPVGARRVVSRSLAWVTACEVAILSSLLFDVVTLDWRVGWNG
ncbi:MAG: alpha/beta hydrolase family protein, partial [Promethearchaeota archaeon]